MTESTPGGSKTLTHDALTAAVKSLRSVGSPYDYIALWVEHDNRPHCTEERK